MMDSIAQSWRRIDTWLQTFAPARATQFLAGLTAEELAEAEAVLGMTLPADFKASYCIHNGAEGNGYLLMGYLDFYPLRSGISLWRDYQELLQDANWAAAVPYWVECQQHLPVQPVWRHQGWLDFAGNGAGDTWCIDLAPAPDGFFGQVLSWGHEVSVFAVAFKSFEALLSTYADQLEAGLHLGNGPAIMLEELTHLQERRAAFQQPSPAKPILHRAIRSAWDFGLAFDERAAAFRRVLLMENATPEDRFFAYYGLISLYVREAAYLDDPTPALFAQFEAEASRMPTAHWVHDEVALLKPWSMR
jgi:cell wall assembly regulator SMI1